jgi:heptosyltransferase-1
MNAGGILVVRLGAMGDIIHTLPAAVSLKRSFPASRIVWAIEEKWAPLLEGNPFVDQLEFVNRRKLAAVLQLRSRLRAARYDLAVDFQGLIKSALVAAFARPERICGWHRSVAREPLAALFYSATVIPKSAHVVDRNLELAAATGATSIGASFPLPQGRPEGELPRGPFILANPLAGRVSKQWPLKSYSEIGRRLAGAGVTLVLNGSEPIDAPCAVSHVSGLPGLIDATRRAAAVIGVDSGPLHLAAALGKPGVAIFGPTDPIRNGPCGGTIRVLRSSDAQTSYKRRPEIDSSMRAISPADVWAALKDQLGL